MSARFARGLVSLRARGVALRARDAHRRARCVRTRNAVEMLRKRGVRGKRCPRDGGRCRNSDPRGRYPREKERAYASRRVAFERRELRRRNLCRTDPLNPTELSSFIADENTGLPGGRLPSLSKFTAASIPPGSTFLFLFFFSLFSLQAVEDFSEARMRAHNCRLRRGRRLVGKPVAQSS